MPEKVNSKELIFGIMAAVSSIAVFWIWFRAIPLLVEGGFKNFTNFIVPVAGLVIAASLFSLSSIFVKNKLVIFTATITGIGIPFLFVKANSIVLGALILGIILAIYAVLRVRNEYSYSLNFSAPSLLKTGLPVYFTLSAAIVSVFYLSQLDEKKAISFLIPRSAFNFILHKLAGTVEKITGIPAIFPESTIDETLTKFLTEDLKSRGISVSNIPENEFQKLVAGERMKLAKQFNIDFKGDEKVGDTFYRAAEVKIRDLFGIYKRYLPVAAAIIFFFAFRVFTWPLFYLTLLSVLALIKILVFAKILTIEKTRIEVEKLTL